MHNHPCRPKGAYSRSGETTKQACWPCHICSFNGLTHQCQIKIRRQQKMSGPIGGDSRKIRDGSAGDVVDR